MISFRQTDYILLELNYLPASGDLSSAEYLSKQLGSSIRYKLAYMYSEDSNQSDASAQSDQSTCLTLS